MCRSLRSRADLDVASWYQDFPQPSAVRGRLLVCSWQPLSAGIRKILKYGSNDAGIECFWKIGAIAVVVPRGGSHLDVDVCSDGDGAATLMMRDGVTRLRALQVAKRRRGLLTWVPASNSHRPSADQMRYVTRLL